MVKGRKKKPQTPISRKDARAFEKSRSDKARKIDECKTSKNVLDEPTQEWMNAPGKSDVKGIDHPHTKKIKPYKRAKKGERGSADKPIGVKSHFRGKKPGAKCGALGAKKE